MKGIFKQHSRDNCEHHIYNCFESLAKQYNIPEEDWKTRAKTCYHRVEEEIDDMECDCSIEDYDSWELVDQLETDGFVCLEAMSIREMEKVEAFIEKMRENPYGKMIII